MWALEDVCSRILRPSGQIRCSASKDFRRRKGPIVVVAEEYTEDLVMSEVLPSDFCAVEGTLKVRACQQKELDGGGLPFTCVLLRGLLRHSGFQPSDQLFPVQPFGILHLAICISWDIIIGLYDLERYKK